MCRITTKSSIVSFFVSAFLSLGLASPVVAADIIVGVGNTTPVHNQVGRALCRVVQVSLQGVTCETLSLDGGDQATPLAVLNNVRNGAIEMGIVTTDWAHFAYNKTGPVKFVDTKFDNLRTLLALHGEPFTIVARRDADINSLGDLKGKRVNIGSPGSNQRSVMDMLMAAQGWTAKSFQLAEELTESEQYLALCHNRVQAVVTTTAHPNSAIAKAIKLCDATLVSVSGEAVQKLVADQPYFGPLEISPGLYSGQEKGLATFGVRVAVLTTSDTSDDTAYSIVKAVMEDLREFTKLQPSLRQLQGKDMAKDIGASPYHPGAIKYFRESGTM